MTCEQNSFGDRFKFVFSLYMVLCGNELSFSLLLVWFAIVNCLRERQYPNSGIEHSAVGIEHSTAGSEHSTVGIEHSAVGIEHSTAGIEH